MLDRAKDDATRLFLLGTLLDGLRTTLFRQTQFAEFELAFHEQAERGEPLTGENLSKLYLKIARDYYGHDKKVCQVDDLLAIEWAYVPHFYYDFYVYQYATSMVASTSLARAVREEAKTRQDRRRRDAYLKMLSSGSSKYAIDLLKDAGVDMTTSAPFDAAIAEMNGTMDEMERILDRQPKPAPGPPRPRPRPRRSADHRAPLGFWLRGPRAVCAPPCSNTFQRRWPDLLDGRPWPLKELRAEGHTHPASFSTRRLATP